MCGAHIFPSLARQVSLTGKDEAFDYGAKPPFTLADIRAAIPEKCFKKNTQRSLAYLARDILAVVGLGAGALAIRHPLVWPLYWLAQGTMFWALFVLGHDCGHGSFSSSRTLNDIVGEDECSVVHYNPVTIITMPVDVSMSRFIYALIQ